MQGAVSRIPAGDAGTVATLQHMRRLAREGSIQPLVRSTAARIVFGVPGLDSVLHARLIRDWVGEHVTFLRDPTYAEALFTPDLLLRQIAGRGIVQLDCDDVAMLAATLGLAIGLQAHFVVVAFQSPTAPYAHVFTLLGTGAGWVAVDPTRPQQGLNYPVSRQATMEV